MIVGRIDRWFHMGNEDTEDAGFILSLPIFLLDFPERPFSCISPMPDFSLPNFSFHLQTGIKVPV